MDVFPDWGNLQHGDSISLVVQLMVRCDNQSIVTTLERPCRQVCVIGTFPSTDATTFCVLDAKVVQVKPLTVELGGASTVCPVPACDRKQLNQVIELCCGIGAFSSVCHPLGMNVVAGVDTNPVWSSLFAACHEGSAVFLHSECGEIDLVRRLLALDGLHSIILSGISCQPFSVGGDRRGLADPRSISLPHTLRTAWLLQSPILILECTPEIRKDQKVQEMLKHYQQATGCYLTQTTVALEDIWCTKRERWFAIFSAGPFGEIRIPPPPALRDHQVVGHVMPYVINWSPDEMQQLELSLYELSRWYSFAAGGIQKAFLDLKSQLPTLLHSCGNQLYDCQCGCRKALSPERISSRGLFGTLVPCDGMIYHECRNLQKSRYFHPKEMFLMQGGSPRVDFGPNLRLAMAGVGQCVSPLVATWILAHVRQAVQRFVGETQLDPTQALEDHMFQVLDARDELWPTPMDQVDFFVAAHPVRMWDHVSSSMIQFTCDQSAKLENFLSAELALRRFLQPDGSADRDGPISVFAGPQPCSFEGARLHSLSDLSIGYVPPAAAAELLPCPCLDLESQASEPQMAVSPTIPFSVDGLVSSGASDCRDLVNRSAESLLKLTCPRLSSLASVPTLLNKVLPGEHRAKILDTQAEAWADDEIRYYLKQLVDAGPAEQNLMLWDPLALTSVIRFSNFNLLQELVTAVPPHATVVSACLIENHWYAICWRCSPSGVVAFTAGHPCNMSLALQKVHMEFCSHRGCPHVPINFRSLPFFSETCCGALAIGFLRHLVFAVDLPPSKPMLVEFHHMLRKAFTQSLSAAVVRPWIWGLGDDSVKTRLGLLLQEHGVTSDCVADRCALVLKKLGDSKVDQALASTSPWRELKWLANSCLPPLQLIRPKELEAVIAKRATSHSVGTKAQKAKGKGKGKNLPKQIDPSGLRIEAGLFQCGDSIDLMQLDIAHVGPKASGVVLTSLAAALPYLKSGRQISLGGLGFIVVDCVASQVPTTLISEAIRVPAICLANSEPVLLDAVLYQLGALPVSRKSSLDACAIVTLSSSVVKVLVFRDQLDVAWEVFVRHPLKHVFAKVPPLVACDDPDCEGFCECWHGGDSKLESPLMEVWGKQWLSLSFSYSSPQQAELWTAHLRVPAILAVRLQTYSGVSGVFLEPKHVDGRQASDAFQVFWMPRLSFQETLHIKQTTRHVIGLARQGSKYGLRCQAIHAEEVHSLLKPGGSFLPPGKKLTYMLGPLPYGTIRASLVELLASISWVARPVQPITASSHVEGVMWKVQSVTPPPVSLVSTDKGDVLITKLDSPKPETASPPPMVAATRTVDLCTGVAPKADPLQMHDPWAVGTRLGVASSSADPVQVIEQKVLDAVLAKLPRETMGIDSEMPRDQMTARVDFLEKQVMELKEGQHGLHNMVVEQGRTQGHQIASLHSQVSEHNQSLTNFQAQFSTQLAQQETRLDSLFRQQMDRLEDLFTKKARHE